MHKATSDPETRRFLVSCDDCTFERVAEGREEATRVGTVHRDHTDHDIVALEQPRT